MASRLARHRAALLILLLLILAAWPLCAAEIPAPAVVEAWIAQLSSDDFDARAEASDKLAAQGETVRPALEKALTSRDIETHSAAERLLMRLTRSRLVFSTFDRDGKPSGGLEAQLNIWDAADRYQINRSDAMTKFDASGKAEFIDVKTGTSSLSFNWQKCWIAGSSGYNGMSYYGTLAVVRSGKTPFLFTMTKGGSVKATVQDKQGKPLKDAEFFLFAASGFTMDWLDLRGTNSQVNPSATGTTGPDGCATIESVCDGIYVCVAMATNGKPVEGATIRVREGQTVAPPAIQVEPSQNGKCILSFRGIPVKQEDDNARIIRRANAAKKAEPKPDEKKDPPPPNTPETLKNLKLSVDDEYLFEGPDAERRQKRIALERARNNRFRQQQQQPTSETNENGKFTLDNLRPGKHRLSIRCPGYAPQTLTVDVPPNGTVTPAEIFLDAGGCVTFKIQTADGKPVTDALVLPIPDDETLAAEIPQEVLGYIRGQYTWEEARNYIYYQQRFRRNGDAEERDKVSVKNLAPGKYSFLVYRQSVTRVTQVFLVCGVSIENGKTVESAPIVFAAQPNPQKASEMMYIKGKVVGASSEVLPRTTIYYQSASSSTGTNLNSDGSFQLYTSGMGFGGIIRLKAPGYKQAEFDCSAAGVDTNNIVIKLEKLKYGELRLRIVDEDGKPLSGATAENAPSANNNNYYYYNNRPPRPQKKLSDAKGEVRLTGLSGGRRRIDVVKEGYYLTDPVRVTILPETETLVEVMMRKGLTVSGKLTAPAGTHFEDAVVSLKRIRDNALFNTNPNATGEYAITGLAPDRYMLFAEAPVSSTGMGREIELTAESKLDVNLELLKKGGFVAQFDPALKFRAAYLYDIAAFERTKRDRLGAETYIGHSVIDADGRADFWGVRPGTYKVALLGATRQRVDPVDKDGEKFSNRIDCSRYSEPIEIKEPKLFSELKFDDGVKLVFPDASASAIAKLVFRKSTTDSATRNIYVQNNIAVSVKGDQASGSYNFYQRARTSAGGTAAKLRIFGTPPSFLSPTSSSGLTLISGLVPGKYKIIVTATNWDSMRGTQELMEEVVAAEFEVKSGERKDLGTIIVEASKTVAKSASTPRDPAAINDSPPEDDMDPIFEP